MFVIRFYTILFIACQSISATAQVREEIILRTSKNAYHAGDRIWFRTDILDAENGVPLPVSKIAHVSLRDSANAAIVNVKTRIDNATGHGYVDIPAYLPQGIYTLTAGTNWMRNFSSATPARVTLSVLNISAGAGSIPIAVPDSAAPSINDLGLRVQTSKSTYGPREKITMQLSAGPGTGNISSSISVYRADRFQTLHGFAQSKPGSTSDIPATFRFIPEYNGQLITGTLRHRRDQSPGRSLNCLLAVLDDASRLYSGVSDALGNVVFDIGYTEGPREIVVQCADTSYRFVMSDPGDSAAGSSQLQTAVRMVSDPAALLENGVAVQVQQAFPPHQFVATRNDSIGAVPFFGSAEYSYLVDDYVKFSNVEDIFREYVRPVQLYRKNGVISPFIYDEALRKLYGENPLLLIDGVPVFKTRQLMAIPSSGLYRIDVVNRPYCIGKQRYDGIISFTTKEPALTISGLDVDVIAYNGIQPAGEYTSPLYESTAVSRNRIPDFRNTLYWSPVTAVDSHSTITFFSSDLKGEYIVTVCGISADGKIGTATAGFRVE